MTNKLSHDEIRALPDRIEREIKPIPMCRDCADNNGRCPYSGELCDSKERAKELSNGVRQLLTEIEQLKQENKIKADAGAGLVKTAKALLKENEQLKQEKAEQIEAAYKEGRREDLDYDDYSEKDIDEFWQSSQAYRSVYGSSVDD